MNLGPLKARIPWWGKVVGRILISRLPVSYMFWHRLGVLEHGRMEDPSYAYGVFIRHFERVRFAKRSTNWVGLELGPGDSVFSAVIAPAFKASAYSLVDAGNFAQKNIHIYKDMAAFLHEKGLPAPKLEHITSFEEVLGLCNATYGTAGLASLRAIPTGSVDFIWSHGALQSVRRAELFELIRESRRILRDGGACSHLMDLTDLLGHSLNNLRFRESLWESNFMARSGFYTNRFRCSEMLTMFREAGFHVENFNVCRWDHLPIPRRKLHRQFQAMSNDELLISNLEVVLTPA